jgi:opacity protein-like surface antigen
MELGMDREIRVLCLAVLAAAILTPVQAAAQAPPKAEQPIAPKSEQSDPNACAQNRSTVGEGGDLDVRKPDGRNLSDKLAQSGGVICPPPYIDPAIKAPTPPGGSMPVIPPPGSPGGNPNIQPK